MYEAIFCTSLGDGYECELSTVKFTCESYSTPINEEGESFRDRIFQTINAVFTVTKGGDFVRRVLLKAIDRNGSYFISDPFAEMSDKELDPVEVFQSEQYEIFCAYTEFTFDEINDARLFDHDPIRNAEEGFRAILLTPPVLTDLSLNIYWDNFHNKVVLPDPWWNK